MKRFLLVLFCFFLSILSVHAEPYFGDEFTYYQPDGSPVQVRLYGDEFYAVAETLSGHVVIRDPDTQFLCYAELNKDSTDYVSSGRIVDTSPAGAAQQSVLGDSLPPAGLRITTDAEDQKHTAGRSLLGVDRRGRPVMLPSSADPVAIEEGIAPAPPSSATTGERVGLVLLIEFPDRPQDATISQAEVDAYCNEPGYTGFGNAGSVRDYFYNQSDGNLDYNCLVTAYYTAQNDRDYYTDSSISYGARTRELIGEALDHLKAEGFDFSRVDGNGDGTIDGVNTFYAGTRVNDWAEGLWPHKSNLSWSGAPAGISTYMQYQITDMTASLTLGTFCHENGHMLCGFPDLYVYSSTQIPRGRGVGYYSLMCSYGYPTAPGSLDAYLKYKAGWSDVTTIDSASHLRGAVNVDRNHVYRFANPSDSKEYFLIETRQKTGYESSAYLPDQGLAIWHVDEDGSNTYPDGTHYELSLEQADGLGELEAGANTGGAGDFFHNGDNDEFSDATSPNANWWDGSNSSLTAHTLSTVTDPMTFIVGAGTLTDPPAIGLDDATLEPVCSYGEDANSKTLAVWNAASGTVSYTVSDNVGWISLSPAAGTVTTESDLVTVTYDTDSLASGTHTATLTVTDPGASNSPQTIPVSLTVFERPGISLSTNAFSQLISSGTDAPQHSFTINNSGGGTLSYGITSTQSWVTVSPASGTAAMEYDTIYLDYSTASLAEGVYHDTLMISDSAATNSPQTIPIILTVTGTPKILVSPTALSLPASAGSDGTVSMVILNSGDSGLTFSIPNENISTDYTYLDSNDSGGPSYSWIDTAAIGTEINLDDDGESSLITIGFDFPFYGSTYSQFQIGANGGISFSSGNLDYTNYELPSTHAPSQSILPFWDDLNPALAGSIRYHSTAERLVVSWLGVPFYDILDYQTFQVVLYPDGRIVCQYNDLNGTLTSSTVGLQDSTTGDEYLQVVYNGSYLKNNLALEFTPPQSPWLTWLPEQGTVSAGSSTSVWFTASASNLSGGVYTKQIAVMSNDPVTPEVQVSVEFIVSAADTDIDGLPDWWEALYYGGPTNANPSALASNGVNTVLDAYVAGFDPTDPWAVFGLDHLGSDAGDLSRYVLEWIAVSGRVYTIYWASNLLDGFDVTPLASNLTSGVFTDSVHGVNNEGFYQLEAELAP